MANSKHFWFLCWTTCGQMLSIEVWGSGLKKRAKTQIQDGVRRGRCDFFRPRRNTGLPTSKRDSNTTNNTTEAKLKLKKAHFHVLEQKYCRNKLFAWLLACIFVSKSNRQMWNGVLKLNNSFHFFQRLKAALHYSVGRICEQIGRPLWYFKLHFNIVIYFKSL